MTADGARPRSRVAVVLMTQEDLKELSSFLSEYKRRMQTDEAQREVRQSPEGPPPPYNPTAPLDPTKPAANLG
jgi:hypothetical protein